MQNRRDNGHSKPVRGPGLADPGRIRGSASTWARVVACAFSQLTHTGPTATPAHTEPVRAQYALDTPQCAAAGAWKGAHRYSK